MMMFIERTGIVASIPKRALLRHGFYSPTITDPPTHVRIVCVLSCYWNMIITHCYVSTAILQTYEHRPRYHERPPTSALTEAVTLLEPDADVTKCKDAKLMRRT